MARLSRSGFSPNEPAIEGSAVAITVESRFSMNSEQATISGMSMRCPALGRDRGSAANNRSYRQLNFMMLRLTARRIAGAGLHCSPRGWEGSHHDQDDLGCRDGPDAGRLWRRQGAADRLSRSHRMDLSRTGRPELRS